MQVSKLLGLGVFHRQPLKPLRLEGKIEHFSLAIVQQTLVVLSGGCQGRSQVTKSVRALDLSKNEWLEEEKIPSLNTERFYHSSCTVGNTVAVICGT